MPWELRSDRPIYAQLVEEIQLRICAGIFSPGDKLPSVRELAQEAAVNPNTMQKALSILEEQGLVYTNRTSGRFVTEDSAKIQQVKQQLAQEQVKALIEGLRRLGFEKKEALSFIRTTLEEEK